MLSMLKSKDSEVHRNQASSDQEKRRADQNANRVKTLDTQISTFSHTEMELRSQLNIYVEKFKQVCRSVNFNSSSNVRPELDLASLVEKGMLIFLVQTG